MSFGARGSRPAPTAPCPCGGGDTFAGCCAPLLDGAAAPTAERLMRSRYTAFTVGDAEHLARTWHPRTRPADIDIDPALRWLGLTVLEAPADDGERAVVEFRADWREGATTGALHERSRFTRRGGRWFYLDGEVSA